MNKFVQTEQGGKKEEMVEFSVDEMRDTVKEK